MYYRNNIESTITLCEVMQNHKVKNIVFSSSATVYGTPKELPIKETSSVTHATNPYGETKIMIERILADIHNSDPEWNIALLRYFNPIGAHKSTLIGENPTFLARPWRDFGTVAFIECNMQNHILPEGFNKWNNSNRDKTARFFEYSPNCDTSKRVSWSKQLSQAESVEYYNNFLKYINNSLN